MLLVKMVKYIGFYLYHRSYYIWSPVVDDSDHDLSEGLGSKGVISIRHPEAGASPPPPLLLYTHAFVYVARREYAALTHAARRPRKHFEFVDKYQYDGHHHSPYRLEPGRFQCLKSQYIVLYQYVPVWLRLIF